MPLYRIIINKQETGEYVTATSIEDAYADIATSIPLRYDDQVQITEMPSPQAKTNLPVGNDTNTPLYPIYPGTRPHINK